jgi:hypothetical protein
MKKIGLFLLLALLGKTVNAQWVSLSTDTVNLGVVYSDHPDSAVVYLKNIGTGFSAFAIEGKSEFPFYNDTVVRTHYTPQLLQPGDSMPVWIVAQPEHNLKHKGSVVLNFGEMLGEVLIPYKFQGRYSNTYYNSTENLIEIPLRTALKNRTGQGFVSLSYNAARDEMYADLDNLGGDVECVYTGRIATFNTRAGATSNSFNCEHTFPQGFFNENLPMKSDIHHLFPTDDAANSQRGNLPFGVVTNPTWQNGGSKKNNSTFEPRDVHKGTTARAMMYFVLRYQDYSNHFAPQEHILRQWHAQYPPSVQDSTRNEGIYQLQNNRNPFVDYPQFAERITSLVSNTPPANTQLLWFADTATLAFANAPDSLTYTLHVYNYGLSEVPLYNLSLSTGLRFVGNTGTEDTLQPGQAKPVLVRYAVADNHTGKTFDFTTSLVFPFFFSVHFNSKSGVFGVDETRWQPNFTIFNNHVTWPASAAVQQVQLFDASGRLLQTANGSEGELWFANGLSGLYVLRATGSRGVFSQKIVIVK